jgi:hypothetical protein
MLKLTKKKPKSMRLVYNLIEKIEKIIIKHNF